jgi:hypothetical protein
MFVSSKPTTTMKTTALLVLTGIVLSTALVCGAERPVLPETTPDLPVLPEVPSVPEAPPAVTPPVIDPPVVTPPVVTPPVVVPPVINRPEPPARSGPEFSAETRNLVEAAKAASAAFRLQQQEAAKALRSSNAEQREEIRAKMKEAREAFLAQSVKMREEILLRLQAIREQLSEHRDVVDSIKETARERVQERRGGQE